MIVGQNAEARLGGQLRRWMGLRRLRWVWAVALLVLLSGLGWMQSAGAAPLIEQQPLTLELLQQRLKKPVTLEDGAAIDLRRVIIDLRPENVAFRDQFYRLVQATLRRSPTPLGLDLSSSLIQGKLDIAQLGLQAPVFGDELPNLLTEDELNQLKRDRRRITQLSQLSRSLLTQDPPPVLKLTLLRGPLLLSQARIEGVADFSNTFFLGKVDTAGADFTQEADWADARFGQSASFADTQFRHLAALGFRAGPRFRAASFRQQQTSTGQPFSKWLISAACAGRATPTLPKPIGKPQPFSTRASLPSRYSFQ
ncbi:MAG TPA: pentapeptide repeat-containing protein, partial [Thermoleptolyngbya sp. M55_K2018_002]